MTEEDALAKAEEYESWAKVYRSIAATVRARDPRTKDAPVRASRKATSPRKGSVKDRIVDVMSERPGTWQFREVAARIPERSKQTVNNTLQRMITTGEVNRPQLGVYELVFPATSSGMPNSGLVDTENEEDA